MTDPREDYKLLDDETLDLYKGLMGNPLVSGLKREMSANKVGHDSLAMREAYLNDIWENGGKGFVERVKKYGRTEQGEKIDIIPSYAELLEGIADYRIAETFTVGPAQCGKTLSHTLLICDTLTYGRCNTGWFYASRGSLINQVGVQFQPTVEFYIEGLEKDGIVKFNRTRDRMTSERYMIENVTGNFSYASTTKTGDKNTAGLATVGGSAQSFSAAMLVLEERSQYKPGEADPLPRRLDASPIPTKPQRSLSTPGGGGGIEAGVRTLAQYDFYPHVTCDYCDHTFPLHPKGSLLKKFKRVDSTGNEIETFLSETGRPQEWYHKDPQNPVESAYIACPKCESEVPDITRHSARLKCMKTGVWFRDWIDSLPKGIPDKRYVAAFNISPLTRKTKINLAEDIIRSGLDATDTKDFSEQRLGCPSETNANSITMEMLRRSMDAPTPPRVPEIRLCGIDAGRSTYWLTIADIIPPEGWKSLPIETVMEESYFNFIFLGDVSVTAIPEMLKRYRVNFGGLDNEPDRSQAAKLQNETVIEIFDQINGLKDVAQKTTVEEGGVQIPCWKIRREKFMNQVLLTFVKTAEDGYPMARLPEEMRRWISNPADNSPLRHFQSCRYDSWAGKWLKSGSEPDHIWHSYLFMLSAYYVFLTRKSSNEFSPGNLVTVERPSETTSTFGYGQRVRRRSSYLRPRTSSYLR